MKMNKNDADAVNFSPRNRRTCPTSATWTSASHDADGLPDLFLAWSCALEWIGIGGALRLRPNAKTAEGPTDGAT